MRYVVAVAYRYWVGTLEDDSLIPTDGTNFRCIQCDNYLSESNGKSTLPSKTPSCWLFGTGVR